MKTILKSTVGIALLIFITFIPHFIVSVHKGIDIGEVLAKHFLYWITVGIVFLFALFCNKLR